MGKIGKKCINVTVAGHQFADPAMWVLYLSKRFQLKSLFEVLVEPDRSLQQTVETDELVITTRAPIHALRFPEESYRILIEKADVIIYILSVIADQSYLNTQDFNLVNGLLLEKEILPPVFTLLNDSYCQSYQGGILTPSEMSPWIIANSKVFETAIGYRPTSGSCTKGADTVYDELLKLLKKLS